MAGKIAADSTIATVWPTLTHQKAYLSGALHKMRQCNTEHGNARIRIGVTGTGQKPYYRVAFVTPEGHEHVWGSFYDNHDALEEGFAVTSNWSSVTMTFDQVLEFYADAIGYKGKRF
jgi:hypothetical protein